MYSSEDLERFYFLGDELQSVPFKDTVHQVCMSHTKNKFVKFSNQSSKPVAERFSHILKESFMRERRCDDPDLPQKRSYVKGKVSWQFYLELHRNFFQKYL